MPIYSVKAPDGQIYEVRGPENATEDQILAAARAEYLRSRPAPKQETTGFTAAASAGMSRLKGDIALLGGKLGVMRPEEAEAYQKAREEEARKRFTGSEWSTAPGTKLLELFGGSLPSMAAPLAVGAAAATAPVSGALGLGALTAGALGAGAVSAAQFTGSNLAEQMKTGKRLEETSGGAAVAAAIPQALLDVGSTLVMPGIGRLLGRAGAQVTEEAAAKLAQQTFRQKVVDYAARTGLSSTVEGTTEAAQEVLAKLQAGQNIADPEARADYVENFLGGAAMAAVLGPFGRAADRGRIIREGRALTTAREGREFEAQQAQERAAAPQRLSELEAAQEQLRAQLAQERDPANIAELGRQGVEQAKEIKRLREMLSISISEPLTEAAVVAHQKRIEQTQAELLAAQQKGDFAAVGRITDKLNKLTESPLNVSLQGPPAAAKLTEIGPARDVFEMQEAAKIGPQISDISPEAFAGARPIPELVGPVPQAGPVAAGDPRFRYLRSLEAEYDRVWEAQQGETDPAKLRDLAQQGLAYEQQIGALRKELEGVTEFPPTFEELQEKHNAAVARAQKALDTAKEQRDPQAMLKALTRLETLQANAPKPEGYQLTEEELAQQKAAQEQAEAARKAQEDALKQQEADSKVAQEAAGLQRIGIYGPTLNVAGVARQARQTELDRVAAGPPPYMEQGLLFEPGLTERVNPPLAGEAPRQLVSLVGEAQRLPGADDVSTPVGQLVRSIDDAMLNLARTTPTTETIKQGDKTFERTVDPRRDAIDLLRGLVQNKGDLSVVDPALLRRVNESLLEIDKARRSETEQVLTTENRPTTPSQQAALEKMANISGTETAVPGSATETGVELKQRQGLEERGVTPALVSTGEVRKAVQLSFGKRFSAPARAFNNFNEFNNYLAGDALAELRKVRMGPDVLETMSRLDRMLPGMDARVRELEAEVARLNALEAEITKGSVRDRANTDAEIEKKKAQIERLGKQIADVLGKTQFSYLNAGQKLADARTRAEQLRGDIAANQEKLSALKTGESAAQGIESMFDFGDLNETLINRYEAQDAALRQELSALNRSFGGLTAARTRAAAALEAAGQSPRITELNRYWEKTKGNMTLAEQTFANREAAREEQRAALVEKRAPVEAEAEARRQEAESLRERARQRIEARVPPAEKPAFRVTPEQAALERAAEPTTPEGKPIPRTTVEFEGRKQTLEGIVKQQEMTEAARGVEPGTAPYEPGRAAMQLRLEAVDKDIQDKTARISDLTDSINNIDKLDPKPFYNERDKRLVRPAAIARADERVRTQRLAAMMEERARLQAEVRQAQGIKRTLQPTKAEKAASEARTREAIAGTPMSEEYEPIRKTQTKKRKAAPLVRATTFAPTFRTGEEERTAASTGLGKSPRPKQAAPSPVSKGKVPLTEEQKKAAAKLAREKAKLVRQQFDALKSLQDYVENRDAFDDRGDDYGRLTEGYASRATQELDADTATALERGETVAALESLAQNGSTDFVRTLAQRLRDVIGDTTKVKLVDGLEVDGQAAEGLYDAAKRLIELDRNSMTEETLTHEATHAATVQTLDAYEKGEPLTAEQRRAAEELDKLYQSMRKKAGVEGRRAGEKLASAQRGKPVFYSALTRAVENSPANSAPPAGWSAFLKGLVNKGQVKAEEIEWSGVNDWLALQQGKVSKDALTEYLRGNGVQVEEVVRDSTSPDERSKFAQFSEYVLAGGKNYREVLLTLAPSRAQRPFVEQEEAARAAYLRALKAGDTKEMVRLNAEIERLEGAHGMHQNKHWTQKNVLAHIRVNDRTDADGNKVLFVEEIQSDWGQEGKKKGVAGTVEAALKANGMTRAEFDAMPEEDQRFAIEETKRMGLPPAAPFVTTQKFAVFKDGKEVTRTDQKSGKEVKQRYDSMEAAQAAAKKSGGEARDLGLQANTEGWLNLALKHVMKMAVEGGYDKVAFINGEQSHQRFPQKQNGESTEKAFKAFYDSIVPNAVRALTKKLGGQVETVGVETVEDRRGMPLSGADVLYELGIPENQQGEYWRNLTQKERDRLMSEYRMRKGKPTPQPGLTITDAMREKVGEGLPLFSRPRKVAPDLAGLADEYGLTNLKEFAAEVMSNKDFRARLDQTEGLLKRIYNAFLRLIGFDPKTVSEMAVDNVYKLFAPNTSTSNTERMASLVRGTFFNTGPKFAAGTPESVKKAANAIVGRRPGLGDRAVAAASGLLWRTKALDRWAPVEALIKMGVAKGKISEAQALQARINMRMLEQRSQLVGTAVVDGVPQLSKADKYGGIRLVEGREGANLRKMLDALKESGVGDARATEEMFSAWMAALRAEKEGVGLAKLNYDLDPAEVATIKSYVESQPKVKAAFEKARQIYKQYNRDLLTLLVDTGTMERAKMEQLLQGDFVPYYRVDNKTGMVQLELGPTKTFDIGNIIDQPELKELVGGNQKILPIFNGAVSNTAILISMATKNLQTREVAYMLKQLGLGEIRPKEGKANSPRFKENGVLKHVAIDPDAFPEGIPAALLIEGMQGIQAAMPGIVKLMGVPAQFLRKWVMRTPLYPLRQVIRDSAHAWLTTGGNFTPVLSSFAEFGRMVTGTSNVEQILQRSGVISSNVYTGDTGDYVKLLKDMKTTSTFGMALAKLDAIAQQGDAATRAVVYESFRKQGMSHPEALLNTLESMNFSRRGTSASLHALSSMIPFFHSSLQGLDAVYRSFKGDTSFEGKMNARSTLLKRGLLLSGMTMAYAAMMQDDEAYRNATPDQRLMNWFVRLPGLDEPLRVPIPFELGLIFKSIPETIINVAFGDTKAMPALKALGQQALRSLPGGEVPLPTAIKPVLEVAMNHSLFNDQPIESMRERGMDVSERYRVNTTGLAKALGQLGVISPVQIEHLIRGYTGNLFLHMSSVVDVLLRPTTPDAAKQPARNLSELPLVGGLFQPNTARGVIDEVFKEVEKSQQAKRTYDRLLEEGRDDEAEKYANQFGMRIALNSTGGTYRQQMGEFAKQRRAIAASDATPEEKRLQLLDLRKIEIEYAKAIKEVFSEAE